MSDNKLKKGFNVGPKLANNAYQGHTKRIKETLIRKASIKKQYYKALKAEGYDPNNEKKSRKRTRDDDSDNNETNTEKPVISRPKRMNSKRPHPQDPPEGITITRTRSTSSKKSTTQTQNEETPSVTLTKAAVDVKKKQKLSPEEVEKLRNNRAKERKEWNKRTSKGQPKLGKRVEVLLDKIKKSL